mmetsp:Transcript_3005/g.10180  ORF Transcript_3005/g.10180 Transcript_3005/m.10180 type:complete len:243 (+) Transcript_3005:478-1206(+)
MSVLTTLPLPSTPPEWYSTNTVRAPPSRSGALIRATPSLSVVAEATSRPPSFTSHTLTRAFSSGAPPSRRRVTQAVTSPGVENTTAPTSASPTRLSFEETSMRHSLRAAMPFFLSFLERIIAALARKLQQRRVAISPLPRVSMWEALTMSAALDPWCQSYHATSCALCGGRSSPRAIMRSSPACPCVSAMSWIASAETERTESRPSATAMAAARCPRQLRGQAARKRGSTGTFGRPSSKVPG